MDLTGKNVLVIGSGKSGIAAVSLLTQMQASPVLFDSNEKMTMEELKAKLPAGVEIPCYLVSLPEEVEAATEVLVLSPGVGYPHGREVPGKKDSHNRGD